MKRYGRNISGTLREALERLGAEPHNNRMDISEEIDLARVLVERSVQHFDDYVIQNKTNAEGQSASPALKMHITNSLRENVGFVATLVEKMSKVMANNKAAISALASSYVIRQIAHIMEEELSASDNAARERILYRLKGVQFLDPDIDPEVKTDPADYAKRCREALLDMDRMFTPNGEAAKVEKWPQP